MVERQDAYPAAKATNFGCWLTVTFSIFVAMILVIVGLFLPPFDIYNRYFTEQYAVLQQTGDATTSTDGGFRIAAATDTQSFGVSLSTVSLQSFEASNTDIATWIPQLKQAVPYYLALQSAVYSLNTTGDIDAVLLSLRIPNNANPELLDMYGWYGDPQGVSGDWEFIPSHPNENRLETITERIPQRVALFQAAPDTPEVLVSYNVTRALTDEIGDVATIVAPGGLQPTFEGTISGSLAAGFTNSAAYSLMPIIRDFSDPRALDTEIIKAIISNPDVRDRHVRQLTVTANSQGFDGIFIDYRGLPAEQRDNFSTFVTQLGENLDSVGRSLGVVVPAAVNVDGIWETGAYDWRAIGQAADYVQINMPIDPERYQRGENNYIDAMLSWGTGEIDRYKILLGLTTQSIREIAGSYTTIGYNAGLAGLGNVTVNADAISETGTIRPGTEITASLDGRSAIGGVVESLDTPVLDYIDDNGNPTARIWVTTGNALRNRMNKTIPYALGGVAFEDLLEPDRAGNLLTAIEAYKAQIPSVPVTTEWQLRWRIVDSAGELVEEFITDLGEDLVFTGDVEDGNYAINPVVLLKQDEDVTESIRSGAQVALFQPTPTLTPLPTNTPTPTPTVTPTPPPVVATNVPASSGGAGGGFQGSANPAAVGRIVAGTFELGGHVTTANSPRAINAMRSAGMTWMKVQIRYGPGASPAIAAGAIESARANGFKILIGTVGAPADLANGGNAYVQNYANWLGGIAALGADAIEVWNEPNLDREWVRDQISGAAYTNMLRLSYEAIKRNNPGTMVISAALAPTGAENAFPGQVVNDDRFLREMVNAGALNYMDCLGIHYNEGATSPTQVSGDFRDNYYTRYYQTMVNLYWDITGGQRPLCFTELGYLSTQGFPPPPGNFNFGNNINNQLQAAWLAQAAALASQSGRVRLLIVWNVDFTLYGADPQAGYAIIRPDGSCPACNALAAIR